MTLAAACGSKSPTGPTACSYAVLPSSFAPCMAQPDVLSMTVVTAGECRWTARALEDWLTPIGPTSGSGGGRVAFAVADNWDAPRVGRVTIEGDGPDDRREVSVSQAGCVYTPIPAALDVLWPGGNFSFQIVQQSLPASCGGPTQQACQWAAITSDAWITITTPMPRVGDDVVNLTITGNPDGPPRTGEVRVRGEIIQIIQRAR